MKFRLTAHPDNRKFCILYNMGASGAIAGMIISLKMNLRRRKVEYFDKKLGFNVVKTKYKFPKVSKEERKKVVERILQKRKERHLIGFSVALFVVFSVFLTFILSVAA